jgi:beta-glucanase (GH16 family)
MKKALFSRWGFAVVASLAAFAVLPAMAGATVPAPPSGFTTTWSDDFTGAAGTALPSSNWKYDTGTGVFGTGEIETMTSSTSNVFEDGAGHLVIRALHSGTNPTAGWTSGRVETQSSSFGAPAGGVVMMQSSIQQPNLTSANGMGYWPAFWMLGAGLRTGGTWPSIGEVDILEDVNSASQVYGTLHCGVSPGGPCNEGNGIGSGAHACGGCQTGYHTYAVQIDRSVSPEQIRWYLDGSNYFTVNANQVDATTWANAVDHPFFIIYDLALGGAFPNGVCGCTTPTTATASGGQMNIDYVAVYNKAAGSGGGGGGTGGRTGQITGNGGKCVDVKGASSADSTPVQLYTCNGTSAQSWTWNTGDSTIRALGKCMDVTAAGTANGTKIQLYTCNGTGAQKWTVNSNGSITNPQSGRCLDDPASNTADGTQLQIYDCNGTAAQVWHMP